MPNPGAPKAGRPHLLRDNQQWVLDWLIKETGRTYHFQPDGRGSLPRSVRSHAMISKHLGQAARRMETLADVEAAAGHSTTALELYFKAANEYVHAQHVVFENNDEKRFLYAGVRRCYDQVAARAPYRLEHVDVPWEGTLVSGNLHLCPGVDRAPLLFYIPGCDVSKENWPHPLYNQPHQRGLHVFSFDGPGQAESNLRGIRLTPDNYERAASAALDYLLTRPDIDGENVVLHATSFGSFWGFRFAAHDPRIKAMTAPAASIADKYFLMTEESPRWKQLFGYLTQSVSEEELDVVVSQMTLDGCIDKVRCPVLIAVGEYDPRGPLDEIYRMFDQLRSPAELWVFADQHHMPSIGGEAPGWASGLSSAMCDWLRDRLDGKPMSRAGQVVYVDGPGGPNNPKLPFKRRWFE